MLDELRSEQRASEEPSPERNVRRTKYLFRVTSWRWNYHLDQDAEVRPYGSQLHQTEVLPDDEEFVLSGVLIRPPRLKDRPVTFKVKPVRPINGIHHSDSSRAHVGTVVIEEKMVEAEAFVPEGLGM